MRRVVITGMGVISPVGCDVQTCWENLRSARSGIGMLSSFDTKDYKVKVAAEVKGFDPMDFGMDVPSARRMDLYSQYAMAAAKQAVDDSKIIGNVDQERLGVYVGSGIGGMRTFIAETEKLISRGPGRISPFFIPMMIGNMAAGNIAMEYGAQGPCLPVVTACATSTHSIGEAFRAIRHGYADAVIAGGTEAAITPLSIAGFTSCQALSLSHSPDEASLPFDARRNGFVIGEGAGIVVLEEYEHARLRGARVYAEVCGYGNTCDAYHVTAPRPDGIPAARSISMAMSEAKITDDDIVYINAHGTGTPLNDSSETAAIKLAMGERNARQAMISSTKSMMGHMLGAAGAVEAIVSTLELRDGIAPPTINYRECDPLCDLDYVPNTPRKANITAALSISLGFGGHNGCLALRALGGSDEH